MKERLQFIDIARGMGILLVVIGHVVWGDSYPMRGASLLSNFIYSFHMPLFFIISGLCIKDTKRLDGKTLKKMARTYLLPYAIWSFIYLLVFQIIALIQQPEFVFSFQNYKFTQTLSLCGMAPLWFLLALFLSEVLTLAIKPLAKSWWSRILILILLAGLTLVGNLWFPLPEMNLTLRFMIIGVLRIFPTTFFVFLGFVFRDWVKSLMNLKLWIRILLLVVLSALQLALCLKWNEPVDVQLFKLANPYLYFIKSANGSLVVILLSQVIRFKWLEFLGSKTKEIMILHYPPFMYTLVFSLLLGKLFAPNIFGMLIISAATIFCCILIDKILGRFRFWKFIMGKN